LVITCLQHAQSSFTEFTMLTEMVINCYRWLLQ
jgi:hypothetical protein